MNFKEITKRDFIFFIVCVLALYILYNIYRKQQQLDPNYIQSAQISLITSILLVCIWKYKQTSTLETRLEEPFKTNVSKI